MFGQVPRKRELFVMLFHYFVLIPWNSQWDNLLLHENPWKKIFFSSKSWKFWMNLNWKVCLFLTGVFKMFIRILIALVFEWFRGILESSIPGNLELVVWWLFWIIQWLSVTVLLTNKVTWYSFSFSVIPLLLAI